jgi:hypothetical protein
MKRVLAAALLLLPIGACSSMRPLQTMSTTALNNSLLPAGTELHVQLDQPIVNGTFSTEDAFTMTVMEPVRNSSGQIVVPAGSVVETRVAGYSNGTKNEPALLRLSPEFLRMNGNTYPLAAEITNVDLALTDADEPTTPFRTVSAYMANLAPTGNAIIGLTPTYRALENGPGSGWGTVLSLGLKPDGFLPFGARMTLATH